MTALVKCKCIVFQIKFAEVCTIKIVISVRYKMGSEQQVEMCNQPFNNVKDVAQSKMLLSQYLKLMLNFMDVLC